MSKEIDIIIPAYKAHNTIKKTLSSIACQTIVNKIMVTIINDCCPEGDYQDIIKTFSSLMDIREIKLSKNSGPGAARQYGIDHTKCPYIMFVDADDLLNGGLVCEQMLYEIKTADTNVIFTGFTEVSKENYYLAHQSDIIWVFGKIYKRKFLQQNNITFPNLRACEDSCFNHKIVLWHQQHQLDIPALNCNTYIWLHRANSITSINGNQYTYDQCVCGLIDGLIDVINWMVTQNMPIEMIKEQIYIDMAILYISYCTAGISPEIFQAQNLEYIKKFYNTTWVKYGLTYQDKMFVESYQKVMDDYVLRLGTDLTIFLAQPNIKDFMDMLSNLPYDPNDIYEIQFNMPEDVKRNNIECGVCDKDYYKEK